MEEEPAPGLAKQIQQAVDRGQVVLIPAPAKPPKADPVPLPRNRSAGALTATFCVLFKLTRSESRMLVWLAVNDYGNRNELREAVSAIAGRPITENTIDVTMSGLRKK